MGRNQRQIITKFSLRAKRSAARTMKTQLNETGQQRPFLLWRLRSNGLFFDIRSHSLFIFF